MNFSCTICNFQTSDKNLYDDHLKTDEHFKKKDADFLDRLFEDGVADKIKKRIDEYVSDALLSLQSKSPDEIKKTLDLISDMRHVQTELNAGRLKKELVQCVFTEIISSDAP